MLIEIRCSKDVKTLTKMVTNEKLTHYIKSYIKIFECKIDSCTKTIPESLNSATNPEDSLNQTVPRKIFMKVKKELDEKTNAVNILMKKVEHLEIMLRFKDQRIEDLTAQIQSYSEKT